MSSCSFRRVAVFGASGAIGAALVHQLLLCSEVEQVFAVSRKKPIFDDPRVQSIELDYTEERQLVELSSLIAGSGALDAAIVATGMLHNEVVQPEKTLAQIDRESLHQLFDINAFTPILIAKHFLPCLAQQPGARFAAISARVGSISDNKLGGWYGYRASKAALNMLLKTASIEMNRFGRECILVGLHPGTVDSDLSKPFQANVKPGKLFSPEQAAQYLLDVFMNLESKDSGKVFDWAGKVIDP